jgi:hypothetical protein
MKRSKPIWIELTAFQVKALASLERQIKKAANKGHKGSLIAQVFLNNRDEMVVRFLDEEATIKMSEVFKTIPEEK